MTAFHSYNSLTTITTFTTLTTQLLFKIYIRNFLLVGMGGVIYTAVSSIDS